MSTIGGTFWLLIINPAIITIVNAAASVAQLTLSPVFCKRSLVSTPANPHIKVGIIYLNGVEFNMHILVAKNADHIPIIKISVTLIIFFLFKAKEI